MKEGRTLTELAQELERQLDSKADYVVPTQLLTMSPDASVLDMQSSKGGDAVLDFGITQHAHRQIGERLQIPAKYYDKMREEAPHLLARNVNHWLHEQPETRMVRTLDGQCRAFLSDTFKIIDNYDLAEVALPVLQQAGAQIQSCEVTERKMYLKAIIPGIKEEIGPPEGFEWGKEHHTIHVLRPGVVISNSEIGLGSCEVSPAVRTDHCSNLAVWGERSVRKIHVGKRLTDGNQEIAQYLTQETKEAQMKAVLLVMRDMIQASLGGDVFKDIVQEMKVARGHAIEGDPAKAVEVTQVKLGLSDGERTGLLRNLATGGEFTQYGLHQALTLLSSSVPSYDRASELERMGADILTLPAKEWKEIAQAA